MLKRFDEFGRELLGDPAAGETRGTRLYCALCRAVLARVPERITRRDAHAHRCVNPHGFSYEIGCFRRVENGRTHGDATVTDTWFPGYAWRVLSCGACDTHVGWHFRADGDDFCGLILSSIRED